MRRLSVVLVLAAVLLGVYAGISYYSFDRGLHVRVTATDISLGGIVVHLNISNEGFVPVAVKRVDVSMYTGEGLLVCEGSRVLSETLAAGEFVVTAVDCKLATGVVGIIDLVFRNPSLTVEVEVKGSVGLISFEKRVAAAG